MTEERRHRPLVEAISLLSVVRVSDARDSSDLSSVAAWFPLVGLVVFGIPAALLLLVVAALGLLGEWQMQDGMGPLSILFGAGVVALWALLSRFMHWDGLGDVADAYWGGDTLPRRLEIMKDSHIGSFAVIAIVLVAIVQVSAIGAVASVRGALLLPVLLCVPLLGRLSATFAAWFGTPARSDGLGARYDSKPTLLSALVVVVTCGALSLGAVAGLYPLAWWLAVVAVGVITSAAAPHLISRRFGGVTGDVMGASVLLTETIMLVAAALVTGMSA